MGSEPSLLHEGRSKQRRLPRATSTDQYNWLGTAHWNYCLLFRKQVVCLHDGLKALYRLSTYFNNTKNQDETEFRINNDVWFVSIIKKKILR